MSYILEALRRAEIERESKRRVPGLHAQPVPAASLGESHEPRSRAWLWVVAGVGAGVLLPLLWRSWPDGHDAAEDTASARVAVAGSVAPHGAAAAADGPHAPTAAAAPAASQPVPSEAAAAAAPAAQTAPKAAAAKPAKTRTPTRRASRPPESAPATQANPTGAAQAQGARPAPTVAAAPAIAPEPRLRSLAELPEDLRRGVPALSFGGSVYSEIAAQRMVIFNGQVLREGEAVSDELVLEQIRPRSAVLRIRGQRFEVIF